MALTLSHSPCIDKEYSLNNSTTHSTITTPPSTTTTTTNTNNTNTTSSKQNGIIEPDIFCQEMKILVNEVHSHGLTLGRISLGKMWRR